MKRRRLVNVLMLSLAGLAALYGLVFLVWILVDVAVRGFQALHLDLFLQDPVPPGMEGGGLKHAFIGHAIITGMAALLGIPIGIGAGVFFAEYGRIRPWARVLRSVVDVMTSIPSIVVGTLVYALMVQPVGHFMGIAGSVALALLMLPVIAITTDEVLRMVPDHLREAAFALGAHKVDVLKVTFHAARRGILTGVLLGIARISGETAPLLFTSFNNAFTEMDPTKPMASLTVTIFQYATGPYDEWHAQAWAASFILTFTTLLFFILAKWGIRRNGARR